MNRITIFALMSFLWALLSGCVHEFPDAKERVDVLLEVVHEDTWEEQDYDFDGSRVKSAESRSGAQWESRYTFRCYPSGTTAIHSHEFKEVRVGCGTDDFIAGLSLPVGTWDIYVWRELRNDDERAHYDISDFRSITHVDPYRGHSDYRDCFEGMVTVTIQPTIEADAVVHGKVVMRRPMAKYVFIATDYDKYIADEESKGSKGDPDLVGVYPMYMPSTYDMTTKKITDSRMGMSYNAKLQPLNEKEAIVAYDYVMMNDREGGAQVQIGMRQPSGALQALTPNVTVPLKRGRITYVRGRFLTTQVGSGIEIDFTFSDDINIKIP